MAIGSGPVNIPLAEQLRWIATGVAIGGGSGLALSVFLLVLVGLVT